MGGTTHRSLSVAIALSVTAHLVALLAPGWQLPGGDQTTLPPLDARLAPLPKPAIRPPDDRPRPVLGDAPPPRPRPRPARPVRPAEPPPAGVPMAGPAPEPGSGDPPGETAPTPAEAPAPSAPHPDETPAAGAAGGTAGQPAGPSVGELWAVSGKIQYDVIRGERNFIVGRTTHAWTHDQHHYSMETVIETAGLVGLLKPFRMVQRSEGRIGPRGLLPEKFTVERDGKMKERADFDWSSAQVVLVAGDRRREFSIAEGDQDVLSLMHHLALQPEGSPQAELLVVTGKSAVRSVIENLGIEELDIPAGKVSAYHLGSSGHRGELKIDIWLARDYANLPVRLKITDKSGEVLDQVATGVDLGPRGAAQ